MEKSKEGDVKVNLQGEGLPIESSSLEVVPPKRGLLLVNLGSPKKAEKKEVGEYLKEFLMDPCVINLPFIFRWIFVNLGILPLRVLKSTMAYRKIWTPKGSPLIVHSSELARQVKPLSQGTFCDVQLGMRYGEPSLKSAMESLKRNNCDQLTVFPMYPQYAMPTTLTCMKEVKKTLKSVVFPKGVSFVPSFYDNPKYIEAMSVLCERSLESFQPDYILFSFHGLPVSHIQKISPGCEKSTQCCNEITKDNDLCYRAQCFETAKAIVKKMNWPAAKYGVSFQSRMGYTPWVEPYTDRAFQDLPSKGFKKLLVCSPSFVADCIETIEELGMRGKESFIEAGGEAFELVPCLNSSKEGVQAIYQLACSAP